MDFPNLCRTCLSDQDLSPIFKENEDYESFLASICILTGLKIKKNDGLPQVMCEACTIILKTMNNFRRICKETETKLLSMIKHLNNSEENIINYETEVQQETKSNKRKPKDKIEKAKIKLQPNNRNPLKNIKLITKLRAKEHVSDIEAKVKLSQHKDQHQKVNKENLNSREGIFISKDVKLICKREKISNNSEFKHENDQHIKDELNNEKNNDLIEKCDLDIEESEYETEFLDIDFDCDTKDWFFKDSGLDNTIYECNTKNKPTSKNVKLKNTEASESNTNNNELDMKIIDSDTKITESEIDMPLQDKQEYRKLNLSSSEDIAEDDMKNEENISKKINNTENQLFEIIGKRAICKLCQKEVGKRSIVGHLTSVHPGCDTRRSKCSYCDGYILTERMASHRRRVHGTHGYTCMYCRIEYTKGEDLIDHVPKCTKKKRQIKAREIMVECDICNKTMQKSSLKTHKDIQHGGKGPVCEHCGRRLGNKLRLLEHLRARHGHDKFRCGQCDFATASQSALTNHERRHRGEKPFVCEQCGAKFHAAYLLAQHRRSHRAHRDIKCDQCPAAFKTNNTLHMHKTTCHNNNVYQCELCPREFKCRRYLKKHVRAVHRLYNTEAIQKTEKDNIVLNP